MRKCLLITLILLMGVSMLYAGDNNSNITTGYLRTPVRNSVINNLDATVFNPAGTTELEDGFHIGIQNEIVLRNYSYDEKDLSSLVNPALDGTESYVVDGESDDNTYLFPTVMLDYTRDNWSAFFTLTVPGGGGTVTYDPMVSIDQGVYLGGLPNGTMMDISLEASSQILGYTIGGAYKFLDMISVSAGMRMLQATATQKVEVDGVSDPLVDSEYKALGFGGIFGINVMPIEGLNIAMRYETAVKMDYEADDDDYDDYRHDFPAYFGMGVGYRVIPKLQLMADFGFNFYEQQAENSDSLEAVEDDVENGWTLAFGAEYDITEKIMASAGICYTDSGANEDSVTQGTLMGLPVPNPNPDLGRTTFGMGGVFEVIEDLDIEFGYMLVLYRGEEDNYGIEYSKQVHGFSLGAAYHF